MNTTTNPTIQDFLVLLINFAITTLTGLMTTAISLIPGVVQLIVNFIFSQSGGGGS